MRPARLLSTAFACLFALVASARAHAQMPTDNDAWKARCEVLHRADPNLSGSVPAWLRSAPRNVPGPQWTTFGWDRDRAGQRSVACVFFYLGAVADHNSNRGHADRVHAKESATMGAIEVMLANHQPVPFRKTLTRAHAEAAEIPKPALTVAQEQAMVDAATTMQLAPAPPPTPTVKMVAARRR